MDQKEIDWYKIENVDQLDSPALVVYPVRVKQNIASLISMIDDVKRLRPHVKTYKSSEGTLLLIAAGIQKFKCATIAEAEMLAICKAKDVLLAYQPVGPKINRLVSLIKKYPETLFSCLIDNQEAATQMSDVFIQNNLVVSVYIDLNLGMNRTGISADEKAVQLYAESHRQKGILPIGLHAYDGHIRDIDLAIREKNADEAFEKVVKVKESIEKKGFPEPKIVAGGSPTFKIHSQRKEVDCSPGTFIYWDKGYSDLCPDQPFLPAALVISRVISFPDHSKICLDLGHKSIASESELSKRVYFLNAPELKPIGQSEEHLVVEAGENHSYKIGDVLYGLPHHICPTVALYERAYTIENRLISREWKTIARDRKIES